MLWGGSKILEKTTRFTLFFLSPVEPTLKIFRTVRWGDRKFQNLGGVIEKYYNWGVSALNGDNFHWKGEGRSIYEIMIHCWSIR